FLGRCFEPILKPAGQFQFIVGGQGAAACGIRPHGRSGFPPGRQHSQMLTPIFTHVPGLKVVCPSNAYDAKGLLIQSIRDNDPVIFCEHKNLYSHEADVPEESYTIPFGEAEVVRDGKDVTIVSYGLTVHRALDAAEK